MPISHYFYPSELGELYLSMNDNKIVTLEYEPQQPELFTQLLPEGDIKKWLDAYFSPKKASQTLPALQIQGSDYQQKVYQAMLQIPYGETMTYGEMAEKIKSAPRAVGQACKRNPIPIIIPCHRVVGQKSIGGYEGATTGHRLDRKSWLLRHEKLEKQGFNLI